MWMSLFCWTQINISWRKFVIRLFWGTIDFQSRKNTMEVNGAPEPLCSHILQNISESPLLTLYLPSLADSREPDFHQSLVHVWGHSTAWCGSRELVCCCCLRQSRLRGALCLPARRSPMFVVHKCSWHKWEGHVYNRWGLSDHTVLL